MLLTMASSPTSIEVIGEYREFLTPLCNPDYVLLASDKICQDERYLLQKFVNWVRWQPGFFLSPNLAAYRDYLLETGIMPTTAASYLGVIRRRYEDVSRDRDLLYSLITSQAPFLVKKGVVDEFVERIRNAIHPKSARLRIEHVQDNPDEKAIRLTKEQSAELLRAPKLDTLRGIRDTAMIALALCTGVREAELVNLSVSDLRKHLDRELALYVRQGKGNKTRLERVMNFRINWADEQETISQ
jgi:integrase